MALVKLNHAKNLASNYSPFNDLFDSFFKDSYVNDRALSKVPAVNIVESDNNYEVQLAAPGLKKEDFKLQLEENVLTISAEKKTASTQEENKENRKITRQEFSLTSFSRAFTLPEQADTNSINATYEDGILNVTIGKKEEAKVVSREITIS